MKLILSFLAGLLVIANLSGMYAPKGAHIYVENQKVHLCEIFSGDDMAMINNIEFITYILPGEKRIFTKKDIYRKIVNNKLSPSQFDIPDKITIERSCRKLSREEVKSSLSAWLSDELSKRYTRYELEYNFLPEFKLPVGDFLLGFSCKTFPEISASLRVRMDILVDGETYKTVYLYPKVNLFRRALVANGRIERHTKLTAGSFELKEIPLTAYSRRFLSELPSDNLRAKFTIKDEDALQSTYLEDIPDISFGQKISLTVRNKDLEVKTEGFAREKGKIGDKIGVKIVYTNKVVEAEIISQAEAVCELK